MVMMVVYGMLIMIFMFASKEMLNPMYQSSSSIEHTFTLFDFPQFLIGSQNEFFFLVSSSLLCLDWTLKTTGASQLMLARDWTTTFLLVFI